MNRRRGRINVAGWVVGAAATAAVLVLYGVGLLDWLELKTLDLRFRYANSMPADPRIVCIDIDDGSIQRVGRWPWPRDVQAGVISVLHELKAKAILYDITLSDPEPLRPIVPRNADLTSDPLRLANTSIALALPDHELRAAIDEADTVYLAFDYAISKPAGAVRDVAAEAPDAGGGGDPLDETEAAHPIVGQLRTWLDAEPQRWDAPVEQIYDRATQHWPQEHPEYVWLALRHVLSKAATLRTALAAGPKWPEIPEVHELAPVYFWHAREARRCGFVVFEPDLDGVMRRMRLVVAHAGQVLPQLAFAVAADELNFGPVDDWRWHGQWGVRQLRIPGLKPVQVDGLGRVLVPWLPQREWQHQFGRHVPADALWQVIDRRQKVRQNDELMAAALEQALAAGGPAALAPYADDLKQRLRLEDQLRVARYQDDDKETARLRGALAEYERLRAEEEPKIVAALAAEQTPEPNAPPARLEALATVADGLAANAALRDDIHRTLARLEPLVRGRLCLVGYTATALADMTPIPTHPRAPGVIAHANLLNGLLLGRTVAWAPWWLNALPAAALGLLATRTALSRGARSGAAGIAVILVLIVVLAGWWPFYARLYWVALTPMLGAVLASAVAVLLYRYGFLERESRQIAQALSQYTSATLARQMAENAELCKRAEMREVTAVFTDLAGFTSISERIGAERTQRVLNISLGRFSDVMLEYEGMVNKFIGDGIFAFWNPVIYPQPDHARRACETAVELQVALRELIDEQGRSAGDDVFAELVLRVGVASGNAIVGPCGSEKKYDYTCIGDSVNVASRLESANKFYGTRVLISGATLAQAGEGFVVRPLGGVRVKGKLQAVPIYELLGRAGDVSDELRAYAERFGEAVAAFQRRDWAQAGRLLDRCLEQRPEDLAAEQYLAAVRAFQISAPGEEWSGALEMTEK